MIINHKNTNLILHHSIHNDVYIILPLSRTLQNFDLETKEENSDEDGLKAEN